MPEVTTVKVSYPVRIMKRVKILVAFAFGCLTALALGFGVDVISRSEASAGADQRAFLESRLNALEERARNLEEITAQGQIRNKVVAPFEITDENKRRVFYVEPDSASVWFGRKRGVAMSGSKEGGFFYAYSASGNQTARLAAPGVGVSENFLERIILGKDEKYGNYALSFLSSTRQLIGGIGESGDTHAAVVLVCDKSGNLRGRMAVTTDGHGIVDVLSANNLPIAQLTNSESGGGKLWIGNADGKGMLVAGDAGGYGIVRAGPDGFQFIPTPGLALSGSVIVGKR